MFIFPPHLTNASALPDKSRKHENRIFFHFLPEFNQSLLEFFNIVDLQLILTLLYVSLNLGFCWEP